LGINKDFVRERSEIGEIVEEEITIEGKEAIQEEGSQVMIQEDHEIIPGSQAAVGVVALLGIDIRRKVRGDIDLFRNQDHRVVIRGDREIVQDLAIRVPSIRKEVEALREKIRIMEKMKESIQMIRNR